MNKVFTIFFILIGSGAFCQIGGIGVNTNGNSPDPSAALDISYNNKGILLPRLTQVQRDAIVNPATGLTIYNSDCNVFNYNVGTPASPVWATVNASNALVAAVSIFANPAVGICGGTSVTFTAVPSAGINSPFYQWQVNGHNVGPNSTSYTTTTLNNGDVVTCILSTNAACVSGSPATSNEVTIVVDTIPGTPGTISGNTNVCPDSTGNVYSITPVAEATSYNWTVPGDAAITAGAGTNSITVTYGLSSGNISVAASNTCGTSPANSLPVTVNPPIPQTPGTIFGPTGASIGSTGIVYSINPVNNATTYTWTVPSDASITAGQGTTSITVTFGSNSGNIAVTASNPCGSSGVDSIPVSVVNCNGSSHGSQTFNYTGGLQSFTVPACVFSITIEAFGAQGGNHSPGQQYENAYCGCNGGYGADIAGTVGVGPGTVLGVIIGGQGVDQPNGNAANGGAGGGGGSFVYQTNAGGPVLLIAAGGGGGGALYDDAYFRGYTQGPVGDVGQSGNCGSQSRSCWAGGCGGGNGSGDLAGNGWNTIMNNAAGNGYGGYGGGGSAEYHGGGGGGGYSGGGGDGATYNGCNSSNYGDGGGGGGSYNSGTNQTNTAGERTGNGMVTFTW